MRKRNLTKEKSLGFKYPECLELWSDKNELSPYDYFPREKTKVWWKCHNGLHDDYLRSCDGSTAKNYKCPKCNTKKQQESYKYRLNETFESFCIANDLQELLNLWDYDLNNIKSNEIGPHSTKQKIWFKCPKGLHGSHLVNINSLCRTVEKAREMNVCIGCNSIGQAIIDKYGKKYLDLIWSDKNKKSYFEIPRCGTTKIWLRCINNEEHQDYDLYPGNFFKTHTCPYCVGKRVCYTNSLGYIYPKSVERWSDKNKLTPFDYMPNSKEKVWFKCENNKHADYLRRITNASNLYDFRCPECGRENQVHPSGSDAPNWKGGITPINVKIRKSPKYREWRTKVYEADGYLCQCCLNPKNNRLRAHHILSFSSHEKLRFDVLNGITLCTHCHDAIEPNSFHNLYGTKDKTGEELEEFINNKRKQLGILIPFNIKDYIRDKKAFKLTSWLEFINTDKLDDKPVYLEEVNE